MVAGILCILSLIAGSFATTLSTLMLTQGFIYGIGFTISEYPIISMINEFWISRRGMAYGLVCAASGLSGTVFPFVINHLLRHYGYATTLPGVAVGLCVLTGPIIPNFRSRLPEGVNNASCRTDWSFVKTTLFWAYTASNFAMGLGYFFPSLYLPSYAQRMGKDQPKVLSCWLS